MLQPMLQTNSHKRINSFSNRSQQRSSPTPNTNSNQTKLSALYSALRSLPENVDLISHLALPEASKKISEKERKRRLRKQLKQSCQQRCNDFSLNHLIPVGILLVYSLIGSIIFYAIENPPELEELEKKQNKYDRANLQMRLRMWEMKKWNLTSVDFAHHVNESLKWYENLTECVQVKQKWTFWNALFYVGTIYTTIGYGHVAPQTKIGKAATMIYATFGIPLAFFILSDIGSLLSFLMYKTYIGINKCCGWTRKQFLRQQRLFGQRSISFDELENTYKASQRLIGDEDAQEDDQVQLHQIPIIFALGTTVGWMIMCMFYFCTWESWDYFTAFYFFFVSLTTIGLGDTIPQKTDQIVINFGFVFLGLAMVSMCIQIAQAKVQHVFEEKLNTIAENYQKALLNDEGGMNENDLNKVLEDIPPWLKPAFNRQHRRSIIEMWEERSKMINKATQTPGDTIDRSATSTPLGRDNRAPSRTSTATHYEFMSNDNLKSTTDLNGPSHQIPSGSDPRPNRNSQASITLPAITKIDNDPSPSPINCLLIKPYNTPEIKSDLSSGYDSYRRPDEDDTKSIDSNTSLLAAIERQEQTLKMNRMSQSLHEPQRSSSKAMDDQTATEIIPTINVIDRNATL